MYGTYIGNNRMFILPQYGGKLHTYADDMSLTPALLIDGCFEMGLTNYIIGNVHAGMTVIDVGANLGYFSVLLGYRVGKTGKVISYEPNPEIYPLLLDNLYLNDLYEQAIIRKAAASDRIGTINFYQSKRYKGNSSLQPHSEAYFHQFANDTTDTLAVQTEPLDLLLAVDWFENTFIDLIKIDVEGGELAVFKGMERLIQSKKVRTIIFEINRNMLQDTAEEFFALLVQYHNDGARFHTIDADGALRSTSLGKLLDVDYLDNVVLTF